MIRDRYDVMYAEQHGSWNEGDGDRLDDDWQYDADAELDRMLDDSRCEDDFDREPTWEDEIHDDINVFHRDPREMRKESDWFRIEETSEEQEIELAVLGPHALLPNVLTRFRRFAADGMTRISSRRIVRDDARTWVPRMDNTRYFSRHRDRSWKRNRHAQRHGFQTDWFRSA